MIKDEAIKKIISDCDGKGYKIRFRDICFCILSERLENNENVYKCIFGDDNGLEAYEKSPEVQFLKSYLKYELASLEKSKRKKDNDVVSFEENRAEMFKLIERTEAAMNNGEIDTKDGLKIISDVRVKLTDKFNISDMTKNKIIIVENKYNDVCPICNHEIRVPTKEDLMEKYNLKEK